MHSKTKNCHKIKSSNPQSAFTIVELLVVIVIIGILATIVIIFYIGTHNKAIDGALQADLKSASTILELDKTKDDSYPTNKESANDGKGLKSSDGTTLDYAYSSGSNSYCLNATKEGRSYYIDSEGRVPTQGGCPAASFVRTWGGIQGDEAKSLVQTSDGGYAIAGWTLSYGAGGNDAFITKYAADGTLSWDRIWGGTGNDAAYSLTQTNDGGYVITGLTDNYGAGANDAFITKYSSDGTLLWSKTWGGTNNDEGYAITQTSDGGVAIAGGTWSYGGAFDTFLVKYAADGTLSWSKTWGGAGYDWTKSLVQTNDGGYAIAGGTTSYGAGSDDVFISKYTADGTLSWCRTWGGTGSEWAHSLVQTSDGGYAMTGQTNSYGAGNYDAFTVKYTTNGVLLWNKAWGGTGNDYGFSVTQTNDNGVVAAGETNSYGAGDRDAFTTKYDANGDLSWNHTWGGTGYEIAISLAKTSDGGFALAGATNSYGAGLTDAFINKYTDSGTIDNCPLSTCKSPTATIKNPSATITNPIPTPPPPMTITFSAQELYVVYPGASQTICKEWTAPSGKQIKGFLVSQATESSYDFFTVSLNGTERYKKSGSWTDQFIDTSATPGSVLKACMSADSSVQSGYGGEVTGVFYN